jgi:uncharacterized membrane protein (UPF0182 family)
VIVAYGDRLAMSSDLKTSLQVVFSQDVNDTIPDDEPIEGDLQELITQAITAYAEAESLLMQGDLAGYAEKIERVGEILDEMEQLQDDQTGT